MIARVSKRAIRYVVLMAGFGVAFAGPAAPAGLSDGLQIGQPHAGIRLDGSVATRRKAAAGDVHAQMALAAYYHASAQDVQSVRWLEAAARQGFAPAENALGRAYYHGRGVYKDYPMAEHGFLRAANQQYAPAVKNRHTLPNVQP